jgi:BirA family transcriptional regulator, biotin operon repressor / biotin---[acetyl-CoA-carboxylase] ligase
MRPFFFITCIIMPYPPFHTETFQQQLHTRTIGRNFWYYAVLNSTSSFLKEKKAGSLPEGLVCLADHQTEGRGQYSRVWRSEPNTNLMFTVVLRPADTSRIQVLPLLAGCSVLEAVQELTGREMMMKWPNDIVCSRGKFGGILAESVFTGQKLDRLLLGIGVNVNQESFKGNDLAEATSLKNECASVISREELLAAVLEALERNYEAWQQGDMQVIRSINRHLMGYGEWCKIRINGESMPDPYKILGIDPRGYLLTLDSSDNVKTFTHEQVRILCD